MSRNRSRIHGDFGNPGDRRSGRVGRRDRVTPRCRQLHSEGVPTTISGGEWIVCGERCGAIGTGQCHRARVTFGDVPVGIQRQHRDRGIRTGIGGRTAEDAELGSNATDFRCGTRPAVIRLRTSGSGGSCGTLGRRHDRSSRGSGTNSSRPSGTRPSRSLSRSVNSAAVQKTTAPPTSSVDSIIGHSSLKKREGTRGEKKREGTRREKKLRPPRTVPWSGPG